MTSLRPQTVAAVAAVYGMALAERNFEYGISLNAATNVRCFCHRNQSVM